MIDIALEEKMYSSGNWFDGVQWTTEDIKYLCPGEQVKKRFRKLLTLPLEYIKVELLPQDMELWSRFLAYKNILFTGWHARGFAYWIGHPLLKVHDVRLDDTIVAKEIDVVYSEFVVSQHCIAIDFEKFYGNQVGHATCVQLPSFWGKKILVGYGPVYDYVRR